MRATIDWDAVRADFPLLQRAGPRQAADLPRLRQHRAEAGVGDRGGRRFLPPPQRQRQPRRAPARQRGDRSLRRHARKKLARFVNVRRDELVLCSGTTFAINLVAYSWALPRLKAGRHDPAHAHGAPRQHRAVAAGGRAHRRDDQGRRTDARRRARPRRAACALMTPDVKLLAFAHVSNVLGTVNPVRELCREARKRGIVTVVDGSQALPHRRGRHRRDRLRFLRLHRPQDVRPHRHRRAVGAQASTSPRCRRSSAAAR